MTEPAKPRTPPAKPTMRYPAALSALAVLLACTLTSGCSESEPAPTDRPTAAPADDSRTETPAIEEPTRFTDHVPQYRQDRQPDGENTVVEVNPVPFDMVFIPGDEALGIAPFYMGETEVTWEMVLGWGYCRDIADWEEAMRLIGEGLRPSWLDDWAHFSLGMSNPNNPVVGATRHTAEMFCLWLSEKTGRTYRLPTPEEWALALRLGGGCPDNPEALLAVGSFQENSGELIEPDPFDPFADGPEEFAAITPVKCHPTNALGLYDLLGNAGEWVAVPGGEAYLMGGHYALPAAEMSADWTDREDHDIWNESYPQRPVSQFWYWGRHHFQGFRLVCEAE